MNNRLEIIKQVHQRLQRKSAINGFYYYLSKTNKVETIGIENCERIDYRKYDDIQTEIMDQIFG